MKILNKASHKSIVLLLLYVAVGCGGIVSAAPINELVQRIVPKWTDKIDFQKIPAAGEFDVFELEFVNGRLIIRGNNTIAMATGLNHYLKYYCYTFVTWDLNEEIHYPTKMPVVKEKLRRVARVKSRSFLNYCTFGYTMPWWKWDDWQRLIDWMALNGINMPLSTTGQEAIWYKVWKKYGLNDEQIRNYFTGPAFLPWHRMANIDHWGGPLPMSWIEKQFLLQKEIVKRERALGMTPVLPAFAGHVPIEIKARYPDAQVHSLGPWGGFGEQYLSNFLDPFDPLFNKIQKDFLEEQTSAFGTDHIYGIDPFNEVTPPSWEPSYLARAARALYSSVTQVDPEASWLQMSWLFYIDREKWTNERIKAYLTAVPNGKMALLDYYCDNTEVWKITDAYYGQPYFWCYLGNFGGNTMLAGDLAEVEKRMENVFQNGGANLQGIGSTLEGFDANPLMYDYVFEKVWSDRPVSLTEWATHWALMRGGLKHKSIVAAWNLLIEKVYNSPAKLGQATLTNARPFLSGGPHWTTNPEITYSNKDLLDAWGLLLKEGADNNNALWKYDITNIGRQVLGNYFAVLLHRFQQAYQQGNLSKLSESGKQMLDILTDLDLLLSTKPEFSLGKWINDARSNGETNAERDYYEEDALTIITIWGGEQRSLNDYANRSWSGLTKDFYRERWRLFIEDVTDKVKQGKTVDTEMLQNSIKAFENSWIRQRRSYLPVSNPDSYDIGRTLFEKYKNCIK
jgi:alpha-N-acetylglucosaminidase